MVDSASFEGWVLSEPDDESVEHLNEHCPPIDEMNLTYIMEKFRL